MAFPEVFPNHSLSSWGQAGGIRGTTEWSGDTWSPEKPASGCSDVDNWTAAGERLISSLISIQDSFQMTKLARQGEDRWH